MMGWIWKKKRKPSLHSLSQLPFLPEDFEGFINELEAGNDRSCAIVGAAMLDRLLLHFLDLTFVKMSDEEREKIFFEANSVLGTFSNRTFIAYAIGIITKEEKDDLDQIRRIRNAFAHTLHSIDFTNEVVSGECKKIKIVENQISAEARHVYGKAITDLFIQISTRRSTYVRGYIENIEDNARRSLKEMEEKWTKLFENQEKELDAMRQSIRNASSPSNGRPGS